MNATSKVEIIHDDNETSKPMKTNQCQNEDCCLTPMSGSVVWIVFKYGYPPEFQGVFREKSRAIEACRTPDHCVCPARMDEEIPQSTEEWRGAWYPGLQDDPQNEIAQTRAQKKIQ